MIDVQQEIRDHLAADATFVAVVGDRLWAARTVPPETYQPADGKAVVYNLRGGQPVYEALVYVASVQFKCYGRSELEANTAYRALHDALQDSHGASVLHAEAETIGTTLIEPDTEWIYVLAFYRILVRDTS